MTVRILLGDVREQLKTLPAESVHCVVTSPPYWGLRDYGVSGQLGSEETPAEHIETMVGVFREVRRVLRSDGVCWVNYGDTYANDAKWGGATGGKHPKALHGSSVGRSKRSTGLKPKDMCGIPFRFAMAMQADGWWWRQTLPWFKRNGMPESTSDRPANSIEYVFMLTKSGHCWYDVDAVALPVSPNTNARVSQDVAKQVGSLRANGGAKTNGPMKAVVRRPKSVVAGAGVRSNESFEAATRENLPDRNFRNSDLFWMSVVGPLGLISDGDGEPLALDVAVRSFKEAHFATFPPKLIEPLILGACPKGGLVLDPFGGAGTTGLVADRLGRDAVLIELNPKYGEIARKRIHGDAPLFVEVAA